MRCAVAAVPVDLRAGHVARPGATLVRQLAVPDAEAVGGAPDVHAARVVRALADEARQAVAGPRAVVHGGDGRAGPRVVVVESHGGGSGGEPTVRSHHLQRHRSISNVQYPLSNAITML